MRVLLPHSLAALLAAAPLASCAIDEPDDASCADGKCDDFDDADPTTFACQGVPKAAGLHDPIAEILIKEGDSCPTNHAEVLAKLAELDGEDCVGPGGGVRTSLVSDRARLLGQPEAYRTVTTRSCGGRPDHGIFFTLLNVQPTSRSEDFSFMEMMAFDPSSGLFNFYTQSSGRWSFVGNSIDVIEGRASCGSCHNAGGPIMKELDFPWVHWDSNAPLPGADQVFASMPDLGARTSAADLEQVMKGGHRAINETRQRLASDPATGSVTTLLQPLFCQLEINLDAATEAVDAPMSRIPGDFFLDPELEAGGDVPMAQEVYAAAIETADQRIPSLEQHRDKEFKFVFPERAHIDTSYVAQLRDGGLVDQDFVRDVLSVDFTRPLYSTDRCDLLKYAPRLAGAPPAPGTPAGPTAATNTAEITTVTPAAIRDGFIENLQAAAPAAGSAEAALLAKLQAAGDSDAHAAAARSFIQACGARPAADLMNDVLMVATSIRRETTGKSIIENPAQVPVTNLIPADGARLDPVTCELIE